MLLDILILVVIATLLILKLKSILGREYDNENNTSPNQKVNKNIIDVKRTNSSLKEYSSAVSTEDLEKQIKSQEEEKKYIAEGIEADYAKLLSIYSNFSANSFIRSAKMAVAMILEAYNSNDFKVIKELIEEKAAELLIKTLQEKKSQHLNDITTLLHISEAKIVNININESIINIDVNFISEQHMYTEDDKKNVVEGSKSVINQINEIWTFFKNLRKNETSSSWVVTNIRTK